MRMAVRMVFWSLAWSSTWVPSACCFRWATRFTEPRLHTAISLSFVFSVISVHRLELCTTPTCCCGLRMLHGSLNVIHGWPVSNSMPSILRQSCTAGTFLNSFSSPLAARAS
ncbi:hypothetical protein D3C72_1891090 [compost metagenome]